MQERTLSLDDFATRHACPACGEDRATRLSHASGFNRLEVFPTCRVALGPDVRRARRLLRCRHCGLWFYNLVPRPALVRELLDQPTLDERWAASDRPTFRRARQVMERELPQRGDVLDVGAHSGGFLDTLPAGWRKSAVEPMAASARGMNGVQVHGGFLEDVELDAEGLDCITAFDVVEHFADPRRALQRIAHALRPGGLLILETGTVDCVAARALGAGWYYLNYLEHFQGFGRASMERWLASAGLRMTACERVGHEHGSAAARAVRLASVAAYAGLTAFGRTPLLWQRLNAALKPQAAAFPPSSIELENDHMFVVARKPGRGSG